MIESERMEQQSELEKVYLRLGNGELLEGRLFGAKKRVCGEVVFQTGMTGYPEALTDPSYEGQILVLTFPLIGNWGVPKNEVDENGIERNFESSRIHPKALIIGELCEPNHWQMEASKGLREWLIENEVVGICDIDTRQITKIIREYGTERSKTRRGEIIYEPNEKIDEKRVDYSESLVSKVSIREVKEYNKGGIKVLLIDCGMKNNQIRELLKRGMSVKRVPWNYNFVEEQEECDRILITNGPGDPRDCMELVVRLREYMERDEGRTPILGICLGHQILGLAIGAETYKMKYGNRGHNIPCIRQGTKKCVITSQNHGYAIQTETIPEEWEELFVNGNDGSNEGMIHKTKPYASVQFHPEAKGGPNDTNWIMDVFMSGDYTRLRKKEEQKPRRDWGGRKVLILGSGGLWIGQSGEFDYSGSQAIKAYREEGLTTILVNPNIATIQTSPGFADKLYSVPITAEHVSSVIKAERPDSISIQFGGQTALNCGIELWKRGTLKKYGVEIIGTPIEAIIETEDREKFKNKVLELKERVIQGYIATDEETAIKGAGELGYPVLVRAAYALGGLGSGFAKNKRELKKLLDMAFIHSNQVIIDKSLRGWKEIEYEVVRDRYDNCITVCNMENIDPLGVHTGESIVVAPSLTLTDEEYNMLRSVAIKTVRGIGIVGECNIQYALNPESKEYYIIEVNARLSRSSALASKATGYPLAYISAKLSLGYGLTELKNMMTETMACFEPSMDYCVVKVPKWDLDKFPLVSRKIGSSMKSIGEAMGIGRGFEEAFQKALRMTGLEGFEPMANGDNIDEELYNPTDKRMYMIALGLYEETHSIERINELTGIDKYFLKKMKRIMNMKRKLERMGISKKTLLEAKKLGFSDRQIAQSTKSTEIAIRTMRQKEGILPYVKQIDTVAGEFPCYTNYLYMTYNANETDIEFRKNKAVIVLGSGVYKIGSSVEFDWCAVNCIKELRREGEYTIVINCNPETVSTDYDEADRLYFEELSFETVMDIYTLENPKGIILSMGGQLPNNISIPLYRQGVRVIGTSPEMVDMAENRYKFSRMLDKIGIDQPKWKELTSIEEAKRFCEKVEYPCLVRPSYVLSGVAMNVAYSDKELITYLSNAVAVSKDYPIVISKFITDAKEIEVDAVAKEGKIELMAISEHVENAGVHSGDATLILPTQDVTEETKEKIKKSTQKIALSLNINGPFNIQFIAKDDEVKVIECNLRVSRTFPFVSKTSGVNFIGIATKIMLGKEYTIQNKKETNRVGVKVAQFSFDRLQGADIRLGVEMLSTGEVACFGTNHYEAYMKGVISTGFKIPKKGILLSIGSYKFKNDLMESVKMLREMNYKLYGTSGTADYYEENGVKIEELPLYSSDDENKKTIMDYIRRGKIDMVINISKKNKIRCVENSKTDGYRIRRLSVESSVPIITDIKRAKLLIKSLDYYMKEQIMGGMKLRTDIDCITSYKTIKMPGLIDVHVHVREPGLDYKEDWRTCTQAALAGGITAICVMPNTDPPIVDSKSLKNVLRIAEKSAYCDYALFVGANSKNKETINKIAIRAAALKMYLNNTYGPLLLENMGEWAEHIKNWPETRPICVHAESKTLAAVLHIASLYDKAVHICHVSTKEEIELIKISKELGNRITCEVSPHHLFSTHITELKRVKPPLGNEEDMKALWENIDIIDCFATDHAPHTPKDKIELGSPGFPGLETALPLLLTAVKEGRLTIKDIIEKYNVNPRKIFNLPDQEETYIEVDLDKEWVIPKRMRYSKCGWTPFEGMKVTGSIRRVILRGKQVYIDGQVIGQQGYGINMRKVKQSAIVDRKIVCDKEEILQERKEPHRVELQDIITVEQFDRNMMRYIFDRAHKMRKIVENNGVTEILKDKVMATIFYEPSTRTRCSFTAAMQRLGGKIVEITSDRSSVQKGESLEDFVRCLECYTDVLVLRSSEVGSARKAAQITKTSVINAGDGVGEHPTQALLDAYTIREERGTINKSTIAMVGDLKNGRTVHSLAKLLSLYDVRMRFVSPQLLRMPRHIIEYVKQKGIEYTEHEDINEILDKADIIYVTRIQKERFTGKGALKEYEKVRGCYRITPQLLTKAKSNVIIMHPLPRVDEISPEIDTDPRAAYFRQMRYGMYVRMALLCIIFNK